MTTHPASNPNWLCLHEGQDPSTACCTGESVTSLHEKFSRSSKCTSTDRVRPICGRGLGLTLVMFCKKLSVETIHGSEKTMVNDIVLNPRDNETGERKIF